MSNHHIKRGTYVRRLDNFGGLDLTGDSMGTVPRFSRLENMWRDYHTEEGDVLESFPGFRILTSLAGAIHGIWQWQTGDRTYLVIHAGKRLFYVIFSATDGTTLTETPRVVHGGDGTLADRASSAFAFGERLYILDGETYLVLKMVTGEAYLEEVRDQYDPITYSDDEPYEQANILSRFVWNRFHIGDLSGHPCGTGGLAYEILSEDDKTCEVTGYLGPREDTVLYIPSVAVIGGLNYHVTRVGWKAFTDCDHLERIYIGEGVREIGISAFAYCNNLQQVYLPDSIEVIERAAFMRDTSLTRLFLGRNLKRVDERILGDETGVEVVYHGTPDAYAEIVIHADNPLLIDAREIIFTNVYPVRAYRFAFHEDVEEIVEAKLDGVGVRNDVGIPCYAVDYTDGGKVAGIVIHTDHTYQLTGRELMVRLRRREPTSMGVENDHGIDVGDGYDGFTHAALAHCTRAVHYDGRVFFTGNPMHPATVFYTARDLTGKQNPAYIGIYNYFAAGGGELHVTSLLPTASYLAVFTRGTGGNGRIDYYHGRDTDNNLIPRIYVSEDGLVGNGCVGITALLRDDPLFLTDAGVEAASREALSTERSLRHRSTLIDPTLTGRDLEGALSAVWEGYFILLFPNGDAYLADSRRTASTRCGSEYEWYHLTGVLAYTNDVPVYRYADAFVGAEPDKIIVDGKEIALSLHARPGELPDGSSETNYPTVYRRFMSVQTINGDTVVYSEERSGGKYHYYLLSPSGERLGGTAAAPTALTVCGEKLLIGFSNGALAVVNTDRRGVMNDAQSEAYTPEEYRKAYGDVINPEWYSYGGHRFRTALMTLPDDCGVSNYTKGTLRGTTVVEVKAGIGFGFSAELRLERGNGTEATPLLSTTSDGLDFAAFDFGALSFRMGDGCVITLGERSRRYLHKQYCLYSDVFARPFGLRRISYTWQTEGKVKIT